jgi:hypothetical protein
MAPRCDAPQSVPSSKGRCLRGAGRERTGQSGAAPTRLRRDNDDDERRRRTATPRCSVRSNAMLGFSPALPTRSTHRRLVCARHHTPGDSHHVKPCAGIPSNAWCTSINSSGSSLGTRKGGPSDPHHHGGGVATAATARVIHSCTDSRRTSVAALSRRHGR